MFQLFGKLSVVFSLSLVTLIVQQQSLIWLLPVHEQKSIVSTRYYRTPDETNVSVPPQKVNQDVWVANGLYQINEKRQYEKTVLMDFVVKSYQFNPSSKPADILKALNAYQNEYRERTVTGGAGIANWQTGFDVANSMFNIIGTIDVPGLSTGVAVSKEALFWGQRGMQNSLAPEAQLLAQNQLYNSYIQIGDYHKEVLNAGYDLTKRNAGAAQVINTFFAPDLNATTTDTATQIFNKNSGFATSENVKNIKNMLAPDGSINVSLKDLKDLSKAQLQAWRQVITDQKVLAQAIDEKQKVILDYLKNQQAQVEAQAQAARQRELAKLKLEAGESSVYLVSTFVGLVDRDLGNKIAGVGNSALQMASAVSQYNDTVSRLGQDAAGMASIVLTANYVGAAITLIGLFSGGGGNTPEQAILDEIREMRKQIAELAKAMMDRFDRVDRSLNKIYETLVTRLDQIDLTLGRLTSNIEDIQRSLYEIESTLNRVETNVFNWLQAGFRRDLVETINGTVNYKKNFGVNMDYTAQFVPRENKFYTWAVSSSQDPLEAGANKPLDDYQLYDVLTNFPLENNVNYLSQFVGNKFPALGLTPIAPQRLGNPRDWALSSEAYMRLAAEWQDHFKRVNGCRIEQIYQKGKEVQSAVGRISVVTNGTERKANYALFDALMAYYQAKAANLKAEIARAENDYRTERKLKLSNAWSPQFSPINACPGANTNGVNQPLSVPKDLEQLIPRVHRASEKYGTGKIELCYDSVGWAEQRSFVEGKMLDPYCSWRFDSTGGKLSIMIKGSFNDQLIFRRSVQSNQEVTFYRKFKDGAFGEMTCPTAVMREQFKNGRTAMELSQAVNERWERNENLRNRFVSTSTDLANKEDLEKSSINTNNNLDEILRNEINWHISNEMSKATSLQRAARELSGAKMLLDSFIALGLSRSLDSNDLLRSLLYGTQRVPDEIIIKELYLEAVNASASNSSLKIKVDVSSVIDGRTEALRQELRKVLDAIDRKKFVEGYRLVDTILAKLEIIKKNKKCQN